MIKFCRTTGAVTYFKYITVIQSNKYSKAENFPLCSKVKLIRVCNVTIFRRILERILSSGEVIDFFMTCPSGSVYNVPSVGPIVHDSSSPSESTLCNKFPTVISSEFPIFHVSDFPSVSPPYTPSNGVSTPPSTLQSDTLSSRPSVMQIEEQITEKI